MDYMLHTVYFCGNIWRFYFLNKVENKAVFTKATQGLGALPAGQWNFFCGWENRFFENENIMEYTAYQSGIKDVIFGEGVKMVHPVNLYGCTLGKQVFIGPFTEIQRNVTIGDFTKVQSHSFICELVTIGSRCFIGHGVMFVNDLFSEGGPAGGDASKWKSTNIGNEVSIGSNATILPVTICDRVVIGAGSVVTKDIVKPGVYAGNPAKLLRPL